MNADLDHATAVTCKGGERAALRLGQIRARTTSTQDESQEIKCGTAQGLLRGGPGFMSLASKHLTNEPPALMGAAGDRGSFLAGPAGGQW